MSEVREADQAETRMSFAEAVRRARNILCADREGCFTCHTVDPYIDALEAAHRDELGAKYQGVVDAREREIEALRKEVSVLRTALAPIRACAMVTDVGLFDRCREAVREAKRILFEGEGVWKEAK